MDRTQDTVSGTGGEGGDKLPDPVKIESVAPGLGKQLGPVAVQLRPPAATDSASVILWSAIVLHTETVGYNEFEGFVRAVLEPENRTPEENLEKAVKDLHNRTHTSIEPSELLQRTAEVFLLTHAGVWQLPPPGKDGAERKFVPDRVVPGEGVLPEGLPGTNVPGGVLRLDQTTMSYTELRDALARYLGKDTDNYVQTVVRANFPDEPRLSSLSPLALSSTGPFLLELIWSYWMEQAMLAQAFQAILLRFQNVRPEGHDPLAELDLSPLRPLSGFLWGWIENEFRHLSVKRRAYEYTHQYGLSLRGRAVGSLHPVDPRTTFIAAFHNLLRTCWTFYKEDADTTYVADAFPLLNALKDLSLVLSEGAGNQFRDLPWQARAEMLVQQWVLARPELKAFLGGKPMVAYPEAWMPRLDSMRRIQRWGDASVVHFRDLAVYGERLLLSVRYGSWMGQGDQEVARTWARFWKPEIQGYLYAYQSVTGVNLAEDATELRHAQPSELLERRYLAALGRPVGEVAKVV